ncbi:unnamed protein product [Ceutorhynchus assimilis]|uniref:Carboxylic ester hydrolase n=1 Tax=Ceutorhynchus assimilis TaxID=467358 RepID=A0A9N9MEB0_9CUCU|nr:unnamed protein product [Ceutorhynchus assimilis]
MFEINNICLYIFALGYLPYVFGSDSDSFGDISSGDGIQIKLDSGILQGNIKRTVDARSWYNFQGIPYAVPPIGNLRFRDPVPFKKWNGILNATKFSASCVEIRVRQSTYSVRGQEDCLYLNVYSSQNPHTIEKLLPVMFWIYGGSFREGSADIYGPDYLMEKDVVVVTFNYRLGVFGFLSTQDRNLPGNYGMKDIILALKWTKRNIRKFGGDPDKVTIAGESAGAAAVGYLLMSKQSKNLFSQALMQSGSPLCPWALNQNARKVAFDLGLSLGINTNSSAALLHFLRTVDLPNAHQAMIRVNVLNFPDSYNNGGPFGPVIEPESEDAFLTEDSYRAYKNGDFHKVPVLLGINSQESKFLYSLITTLRPILFLYDISPSLLVRTAMNISSIEDKRIVGTKIKQHYFKSESFVSATDVELAEFFSDDLFVRPITKTAQLLARHVPVYFYIYDYEGSRGQAWINLTGKYNRHIKGVGHATELWYLWNPIWAPSGFSNDEEKLTTQRLVTLWTNFFTYGNPTPTTVKIFNDTKWPRVKGPNIDFFYIGRQIRSGRNFKGNTLRFWNSIYSSYSKGPFLTY